MALATVSGLSFAYPGGERPALTRVSLTVERGEIVLLLGPSGCGKSTLLRALAGLVPHFHGGRFAGRVEVAGRDTRRTRPSELAGTVATLFQDPEDQVVLTRVMREVAFGLENLGTAPAEIVPRAYHSLAAVGAAHLAERAVAELSGGELQRVCLASALALEPQLLLLDEPTSQLDPEGAEELLQLARESGAAVVFSEHRPRRALDHADRVVFLEEGKIVLDAPTEEARTWLDSERPAWVAAAQSPEPVEAGQIVCRLRAVSFAYRPGPPVVSALDLALRRGEIVALEGENGSGKTTIAKLAAGLLQPDEGIVECDGRSGLLLQDPGRYLLRERVDEEVELGANAEQAQRALASVGLAGHAHRHPRDLSSGERERVALAAVLATAPDLLVLDEPTRGVDPASKLELVELLRGDARPRATLVVTHDADFAAAAADRIVSVGRARKPVHA